MKEASPKVEAEEPIHSDADDEEELFSERARLHCFRDGDWTERGAGDAKLLRHKESGKSRFLMRHETSSKVIANFLVVRLDPYCDLRPSVDSEKCWVWTVLDQSEVKQVVEQFALSFSSAELAAQFAIAFEIAKDYNDEALGDGLTEEAAHDPKPNSSAASAAQESLQTTAVSGVAADSQAAVPSAEEEEQYVAEEEVTNIPGWTPSVTLEVHNTVQTGEEGEEEIYSQRSKLFRFREGEWKERGIGNAKLLKNKETGIVRFMLRQEKTLKVVANFYVIEHETYCDLRPHADSDKFWVWTVPDSSEDEPVVEQFALKFGNPELAAQFAEAFNSAKLSSDKVASGEASSKEATTGVAAPASPQRSAAMASDGGAGLAAPAQTTSGLVSTTGSYANPASSGSSIFAGLSFGGATSSSFTGFSGLASGGSSLFGTSGFTGMTSNFPAGSQTAGGANGGLAEAGHHAAASNEEDDRYVAEEEEVTTIPGWTPTVSLEVQDTIPTGEENEEETYCQRSKLYRFRDGEWKERGIGNARLLRHKESGKVRFILRQEKTLKVVANFVVIEHETYCNLRPNSGSDKCWVWVSLDCSESEQIMEQFALKFGNAELAQQFADAFNNAKHSAAEASSKPTETEAAAKPSPSLSVAPEVGAAPSGSGMSSSGLFAGVASGGLFSGTSGSSSSSPFTGGASSGLFSGIGNSSGSSSSSLAGGASSGLFSGSGGSSLFSSAAATGTGASLFSGSNSMSSASPWAGGAQSGLFAGSGGSQSSSSLAGSASLFSGSSGSSLFGGASTAASGSGLFSGVTGSLFSSASSSAAGLSSGAAGSSTSSGSSFFGSSSSFFSGASSSPSPLFTSGGLFSQSSGSTSENGKAVGASPAAEEEDQAAEQEENEEEEITNIPGWTPSVTLEVKETIPTGEEDEDEIYSQRSKLYRFRDGEWKERGVGNAKLLKHKESGKVRFVLRQEKTLKVVANFNILRHETYCDLRPNSGSDKCWVWSVPDFSEEEQIVEQFALKFGNAELATQFQEAFESAKDCNSKAEVLGSSSCGETGRTTATEPQSLNAAGNSIPQCSDKSLGATFASPAQTSSLFSNVGSFTNSASSGSPAFGGLGFGGASSIAGIGGGTAESSQPQEEEEKCEEEEEITNIPGWTPSVTLEVQDTIPTGEENEEEIYCQRSKLYRFRDGEWKERGIGNAKLLQHKETGMVRFMLRQEKTLKVVANFYVIQHDTYCDLRMNSTSDKLRVWTAPDYSESEQIVEQFALKFGNAELAEQFEETFNAAKQSAEGVSEAAATGKNATPTTSPSLSPAPAPPAASGGSGTSSSCLFAGAAPGGLFSGTSGSSSSSPVFGGAASGLFSGIGSSSGSSTSPLFSGASSGLFSGASLFSSTSMGTGSGLFSGSGSSSLFSSSSSTGTGAGLFSGSNSMSSASPWAGGAQSGLFAGSGASQSSLSFAGPAGLFAGSSSSSSSSSSSALFSTASTGSASSSLFSGTSTGSSGSGLFAGITGSLFSAASSSAAGLSTGAAGSSTSSGSSLFGSSPSFFSGASSSPSPLFTSGGLFSQSSGSTSENGQTAGASPAQEEQAAEQEENEEEEITNIPGWTPSVTLEVKDTIATGEEDEDEIYSQRSKLYRFRDGEWKERGIGNAKLLKHKESGKVRFMLRQEKTLKVVANFYVLRHETYCDLRPNLGSDKCWVWTALDLSEDEQIVEQFALKFGNSELATQFQEAFESAKDCNSKAEVLGKPSHGETPQTTASERQSHGEAGTTFASPAQTSSSLFGNVGSFTNSASSGSLSFGGLGFSAATSFAGLGGETAESAQPQEEEERYEEEEEITNIPGWAPSVTLEVQDTIPTGEENEDEIYCQRSKLYRFRDSEWKERGIGNAKLLKHKETGKVRFMLRQEKTLKVVANFYVIQHETYCDLRMNPGSDKLRVWTVPDYSESEQIVEQFALKFSNAELAEQFEEAFNAAKQSTEGACEAAAATKATPTTSPSLSPALVPPPPPAGAGGNSSSASFAGVAPSSLFSGIGSSSSSSSSPFSGGAPSGLFSGSGGASLFSGASTGSSSTFNFSNTSTSSAPGLFSGSGSASFFSGASSAATGSGLFAGSSGSSSSPLAGGALSGLFAGSSASSSSGFGGSASTGLFSGASATASPTPLFGGGSSSSLFGQSSGSSSSSGSSTSLPSPFAGGTQCGLFSGASSSTLLLGGASSLFSGSGGSSSSLFAGSYSSSSSLFAGTASSSSLFAGSGSGVSLFAGNSNTSLFAGSGNASSGGGAAGNGQATAPHVAEEEALEPEQDENEEEEITNIPGWTPSVTLEVKETIATGEEDEEEIYAQRSKLYRFRDGEWKERGIGKAKLLKHKESGKVRFMLRQEKTFKVVANFLVIQHETYCDLRPSLGSDKCWVWTVPDYSEEEQIVEQFALKFGSSELAVQFREAFEQAKDSSADSAEVGGTEAKEKLATVEVPAAATTSKSLFGFAAAPQGVTFGLPAQTSSSLFTLGPDTGSSGAGHMAGFGSFANDAQPAASPADEDEYVVEEEITNIPGWSPSVSLEVKETISTGEEDEGAIYEQRAKLFRFRDGEWKERGVGVVKLLKHKDNGKVRFMLRQEKTFKVIANFYVVQHETYCDLRPHAGSDKFWVWTAPDYSEDEQVVEKFALKFGNAELAAQFADAFNTAKQCNGEALGDSLPGNTGASTAPQVAAGATAATSSLFGGGAAFSTFSGFSGGSSSSTSSVFASTSAASNPGGLQLPGGSGGIRMPETSFAPAGATASTAPAGATAAASERLASLQQQRISNLESQIEDLRRELQEVKDQQRAVVVKAPDEPNPEINEVKDRLALLEELRNEDHAILLRLEESSRNSKASQHSKDVMDRLDKVLECVMEAPRRRQPVVRRPQLSDRLLYMQAIRDVQEEPSDSEIPAVRISQLPHRPRLGNSRGVPGALLRQIG